MVNKLEVTTRFIFTAPKIEKRTLGTQLTTTFAAWTNFMVHGRQAPITGKYSPNRWSVWMLSQHSPEFLGWLALQSHPLGEYLPSMDKLRTPTRHHDLSSWSNNKQTRLARQFWMSRDSKPIERDVTNRKSRGAIDWKATTQDTRCRSRCRSPIGQIQLNRADRTNVELLTQSHRSHDRRT